MLAAISAVRPVLNARGMTMLGPFVLMVLACGIVRLRPAAHRRRPAVHRPRRGARRVAERLSSDGDRQSRYKIFAEALTPQIESGDLIFVKPSWHVTPIFYYTQPYWKQFVGADYAAARKNRPRARVWTLAFYDEVTPGDLEQPLAGDRRVLTIERPGARATLYEPPDVTIR